MVVFPVFLAVTLPDSETDAIPSSADLKEMAWAACSGRTFPVIVQASHFLKTRYVVFSSMEVAAIFTVTGSFLENPPAVTVISALPG